MMEQPTEVNSVFDALTENEIYKLSKALGLSLLAELGRGEIGVGEFFAGKWDNALSEQRQKAAQKYINENWCFLDDTMRKLLKFVQNNRYNYTGSYWSVRNNGEHNGDTHWMTKRERDEIEVSYWWRDEYDPKSGDWDRMSDDEEED